MLQLAIAIYIYTIMKNENLNLYIYIYINLESEKLESLLSTNRNLCRKINEPNAVFFIVYRKSRNYRYFSV